MQPARAVTALLPPPSSLVFWTLTATAALLACGVALVSSLVLLPFTLLPWLIIVSLALASLGWKYVRNLQAKRQRHSFLGQTLDAATLRALLGGLPPWAASIISGGQPNMAWINTMIAEVWPVLRLPLVDLIRRELEPQLNQAKPAWVKSLGFQHLALGDEPFRITRITPRLTTQIGSCAAAPDKASETASATVSAGATQSASAAANPNAGMPPEGNPTFNARSTTTATATDAQEHNTEAIVIDLDFLWQPADPYIAFFVEFAAPGPTKPRVVPRLVSLSIHGSLRIILTPLLPYLPGFGAVLMSLSNPPTIRFGLDFGTALGGRFTAAPVTAFLEPLLKTVLTSMLVWPNRVVIPLLPDSISPVHDLQLRTRGILKVTLIGAQGLRAADWNGTSDPQAEVYIEPGGERQSSGIVWSSMQPVWEETFYLAVQEPTTQSLTIEVNDVDRFNAKELLQLNVLKGLVDTFRSRTLLGKASLPLSGLAAEDGLTRTQYVTLLGRGGVADDPLSAQVGSATTQQQGTTSQRTQWSAQAENKADSAESHAPGTRLIVAGGRQAVGAQGGGTSKDITGSNRQSSMSAGGTAAGAAAVDGNRGGARGALATAEAAGPAAATAAAAAAVASPDRQLSPAGAAVERSGGSAGRGEVLVRTTYLSVGSAVARARSVASAGAGAERGVGRAGGMLLVDVMEVKNLPAPSTGKTRNPYVVLRLGQQTRRSAPIFNSVSAQLYMHAEFSSMDVERDAVLKLSVYDLTWLVADTEMCSVVISLRQLVDSAQRGSEGAGVLMEEWQLHRGEDQEQAGGLGGAVRMRVQFVPFTW